MVSTPTPEEFAALQSALDELLRRNETLDAELAATTVELKTWAANCASCAPSAIC